MLKKIVTFLIFFLLTIGNGAYIGHLFQNYLELTGLAILLIATLIVQRINLHTLRRFAVIIIFSVVLTFGSIYYDISQQSIIMIFFSSLLLMSYSVFSDYYLSDNRQIKIIGDALLCGMIFNSIVGLLTGTLGLSIGSKDAIINVLFQSGMEVKNYCGGIWLVVFIAYYIYYYRNGEVKNHLVRFLLIGLLLLLSGSKGACFLVIVFILGINFKKVLSIKKNQAFLFYSVLIVVAIMISAYIYRNVLINIPTYAYRMRGIDKIIDISSKDFNRLMFGFSDIAYADTGFDYTINMRNYLGWSSSVEMAYINIIIKNGILGYIAYGYLFKNILKQSKKIAKKEKNIAKCMVAVMIFSGFTETYIASVHYVVGPALFCLVYSVLQKNNYLADKREKNSRHRHGRYNTKEGMANEEC